MTATDATAAGAPAQADLARRARAWLFEACFPFWASRGVDPRGGFRERLALDGSPLDDATGRVRVQARQTYVFAHAALLGWAPARARDLARRGVEAMLGPCRRPDGLFGRTLKPGAGLADDQPELYDNAFCLMALSWAARALGEPALLDEADACLAALDARLAHPAGGFHETLPPRAPRRQNPHMHLFEAALSLHAADPARGYLARADAICALLEAKFVEPAGGALREYFDDDWSPATGAAGATIEPGHMFEWTWLLGEYARAKGAPLSPLARRLYAAALPFVDARGFVPQTATLDGRVDDASRRTWPQTEALKAHIALHEAGDEGAAARAGRCLASLFDDYLSGVPAGGWRDHFDAAGAPLATDIPASTGYHVVLALAEYLRAFPAADGAQASAR